MRKSRILLIILIITLILTACTRQTIEKQQSAGEDIHVIKNLNGIDESRINKYDIQVDLNEDEMTYTGKQTVRYVNNTDIDLEEIYFHLYPNAFKSLEEAPILFNTGETMDASAYIPGHIDIVRMQEDGKDLEWNIQGDKDTILSVKLVKPLRKGKEKEIYLEYKVKLPTTKDRFGYHEKGINFGNWYPIACVYDDKGWNLGPYYNIGDPFYSETSNYKVSITLPKDFIVATSGKIMAEEEDGSKKTYDIEGKLIRDFAWVASKDFVIEEKMVEGTIIKLYSIKDDSEIIEKSLETGEKSLKIFNRIFGKYPYKVFSIVNTEFPSGMEYPGIILISNDYFNSEMIKVLETIIVHETAHQWWYGLVGNNQVDEAWLDEGLTTYSEVIYNKEVYGKEVASDYYIQNIKLGYDYSVQYLGKGQRVNKPLSEFQGWNDYAPLVYARGAMFIHEIKESYGEEVLYEILNKYFNKFKFHIATTEDLIQVCEDVTGESFDGLVDKYLNGNE